MSFPKNYGLGEKYNKYSDKFIELTDTDGISISEEFEEISNKFEGKARKYILGMMLDLATSSGRADIIDHLLNLGAKPSYIEPDNYILELISDGDISRSKIKKMEKVYADHGYNANLHDTHDRENKIFY